MSLLTRILMGSGQKNACGVRSYKFVFIRFKDVLAIRSLPKVCGFDILQ